MIGRQLSILRCQLSFVVTILRLGHPCRRRIRRFSHPPARFEDYVGLKGLLMGLLTEFLGLYIITLICFCSSGRPVETCREISLNIKRFTKNAFLYEFTYRSSPIIDKR